MDSKQNCNPQISGIKDRAQTENACEHRRSQNEPQENSTSPLSCNQMNDEQVKCYHSLESVGSRIETQSVSDSSEPFAPANIDATETIEEEDFVEFTRTELDNFAYLMEQLYDWSMRDHKCEFCDFVTKKKTNLNRHVNRIHPELRKKYKCRFCNYTSFKEIEQRKHTDVTHFGVKEYKCHLCKYSTTVRDRLKKHIGGVHLKLKPHKCGHCGYATAWSSSLRYHRIRVHKIDD